MQFTLAAIAGLAVLASALPQSAPYYPSTPCSYATGTAYSTGGYTAPTGTAPSVPYPTAGASCPVDGALVCNGPYQYGLCNWGRVLYQPVAEGTQCKDGAITFADGFIPSGWPGASIAPPVPTATPSGGAYSTYRA